MPSAAVRGTVQFFLFSGIAWFVAGGLFLSSLLVPRKRFESAVRIVLLLSIGLGALSGTPLPWWLATALIAATFAYAMTFGRNVRWLGFLAAALVVAAIAYEAFFFFARPRQGPPPPRIAVVGDSLSSGGFDEREAWPDILSRSTGIPIENLSRPAETVVTALAVQAPLLGESRADLVILEIGGNDMLGGTSPSDFTRDLEQLMMTARDGGRREVMMLELPILPGKWAFGAAQRRLARRHSVRLIPKRLLARLLASPANVSGDELHLSSHGHEQMAREVRYWLGL